jgi:hypothetical protein
MSEVSSYDRATVFPLSGRCRLTTPSRPAELRTFRRNPAIEEAPLQGELMLFDPGTSKFFVLNRTMAFVWRCCDGEHTLGSLLDGLQEEFAGVDPASSELEIRQALEELTGLGLLVDS